MNNSNPNLSSLQCSVEQWGDEGNEWMEDAERVLSDAYRFMRLLEDRENTLDARDASLQKWQKSLENREQLLLEREQLLTKGMLELEQSDRDSANGMLESIQRELSELRNTLGSTETTVPTSSLAPSLPSIDPNPVAIPSSTPAPAERIASLPQEVTKGNKPASTPTSTAANKAPHNKKRRR